MLEEINLGSAANDGTGDSLRVAGEKVNNIVASLDSGQMVDYEPNALWFEGTTLLGDTALDFDYLNIYYMRVGNTVTMTGYLVIKELSGNFPSDASSRVEIDLTTIANEQGWFTSITGIRGLAVFDYYGESSDKPITSARCYRSEHKLVIHAGETSYINTNENMVRAIVQFNIQCVVEV